MASRELVAQMESDDGTASKQGDAKEHKAELPENMWSLNLVAAIGQAKCSNGTTFSPLIVALLSFFMGFGQIFTVFLIIHDLDPDAKPVTTPESCPYDWIEKSWTVNAMKWIMITLLSMGLTSEAAQCEGTLRAAIKVSHGQLLYGRALPVAMCFTQYVILCGVVFGGVAVILSCQAVPDILYNSLAITFIVGVDELLFEFIAKCFDLKLNFEIDFVGHTHDEDSADEDEEHEMPAALQAMLMVMLPLPLVLAYATAGWAFWKDVMPTNGWGIHQI